MNYVNNYFVELINILGLIIQEVVQMYPDEGGREWEQGGGARGEWEQGGGQEGGYN